MSVDPTQVLSEVYSGVAEVGRTVSITAYADTKPAGAAK